MSDVLLQKSLPAQKLFFDKHQESLSQTVEHGQKPTALFIACSDSRLVPERMLGIEPGEFFMYRVPGNVIPPYSQVEPGTAATLEFSIQNLGLPHIVICGHTGCGVILALDEQVDMSKQPGLWRWTNLARPAAEEIDRGRGIHEDPAERHRAIVEENVRLQLSHLETYPYIREALATGKLKLHGWVYDLAGQEIYPLPDRRPT